MPVSLLYCGQKSNIQVRVLGFRFSESSFSPFTAEGAKVYGERILPKLHYLQVFGSCVPKSLSSQCGYRLLILGLNEPSDGPEGQSRSSSYTPCWVGILAISSGWAAFASLLLLPTLRLQELGGGFKNWNSSFSLTPGWTGVYGDQLRLGDLCFPIAP